MRGTSSPISSSSRRRAASSVSSPGRGWLQQVFDQSPPEWYLSSARRCRSISPRELKRKTENARWSTPSWCALSLGAVPISRSFSSTSTTSSSTTGFLGAGVSRQGRAVENRPGRPVRPGRAALGRGHPLHGYVDDDRDVLVPVAGGGEAEAAGDVHHDVSKLFAVVGDHAHGVRVHVAARVDGQAERRGAA